jgi:deoxyribonuclease V
MKLNQLNPWKMTPAEAARIQMELAGRIRGGRLPPVRIVLGLDVSYRRNDGTFKGIGVLVTLPALEPLNSWSRIGSTSFPYVPGLLSFREIPPLLPILERVPQPDLSVVDGHGIAHPRGLGLASHIGLITGVPTIGCAKRLLVGLCEEPGPEPGDASPIILNNKVVGFALVSPGHLLDPEEALKGVIMCLTGYRLPEPTRLADKLSKGKG